MNQRGSLSNILAPGHNCPIEAICMNKLCAADQKTFCYQCQRQFHTKCNYDHLSKNEFKSQLDELKQKIQQSIIMSQVKKEELQILQTQIMKQLREVEYKINKIFEEEYNKMTKVEKIDRILNSDHSDLDREAWMTGYDLITNADRAIPYVSDLNIEMKGLRSLLDNICRVPNQQLQGWQFDLLYRYNCNCVTYNNPLKNKIELNRALLYPDQIATSSDGKYFGVDNNNSIDLWDLHNQQELGSLRGHSNYITTIEFSKCGKYVISGSMDKTIKIWNIQTKEQIGELIGHNNTVFSVQYSVDERYILSGSQDQTIRMWEVETTTEIEDKRIKHNQPLGTIAPIQFSPCRNYFLVGDTQGKIIIYDFQNKKQFRDPLLGHTKSVYCAKFSSDGKLIVSCGADKTIRIWSCETQTQLGNSLEGHTNEIASVFFSPDMKYVVSGSEDKTLRVWKWREATYTRRYDNIVRCAKFSANGQYIISGNGNGLIEILEVVF